MTEKNNLDFLRFTLALMVFLFHSHALSQNPQLAFLGAGVSADLAVKSFFVISGWLIFASYEKSPDLKTYFRKRIRRIYPAYCCIILLSVFFGAMLSSASLTHYFSIPTFKYLLANLVFLNFLQPTLPGLFTSNIFPEVNGALWTLKIEVFFYALTPLIFFAMKKFARLPLLLGIYLLSYLYFVIMGILNQQTGSGIYLELQRQLPGQLFYFMAGALIFYYPIFFEKYSLILFIAGVTILTLGTEFSLRLLEPLALAMLVHYLACSFRYLGNFGKYGDFSYGIYIVHFPVLQALIAWGIFKTDPLTGLLLALLLVAGTAFLFWHWVEKPFLRRSSHYVMVNKL